MTEIEFDAIARRAADWQRPPVSGEPGIDAVLVNARAITLVSFGNVTTCSMHEVFVRRAEALAQAARDRQALLDLLAEYDVGTMLQESAELERQRREAREEPRRAAFEAVADSEAPPPETKRKKR